MNAPKSPLAVLMSISPRLIHDNPATRKNAAKVMLSAAEFMTVSSHSLQAPTLVTTRRSPRPMAWIPSTCPVNAPSVPGPRILLAWVIVVSVIPAVRSPDDIRVGAGRARIA